MTSDQRPEFTPRSSVGLVPLCDMSSADRYKGEDGGLYGKGQNIPPAIQMKLAMDAARTVRPLDRHGRESSDGRIALISIGMSNTTQSFSRLVEMAENDPFRSPRVKLVDCAQNGRDGLDWGRADEYFTSPDWAPRHPWRRLAERLAEADIAPLQVQAAWIKLARKKPAELGEFPEHARILHEDFVLTLRRLKEEYPNVRLAWLSSRTYAGYATTGLNPEPYAYEGAFAVRWTILEQIGGSARLNADPLRGKITAPTILWGPYLWADGEKGRKVDGLIWRAEDMEEDGTHPSIAGRTKVAEMLLRFLHNDPTASWYLR